MSQIIVRLMLGAAIIATTLHVAAGDGSPKKLTTEEEKVLQASLKEHFAAALKYRKDSNYTQAEQSYRKALQIAYRLYPELEFPKGHDTLALSLFGVASELTAQDKFIDAEPFYRKAVDMFSRLYPAGVPGLALTLNRGASDLRARGHSAEAERLFRDALEINKRLYPKDKFPDGHVELAATKNNLATSLDDQGKFDEAEQHFRDVLTMRRKLFPESKYPNGHTRLASSFMNLGGSLQSQGRFAEAERQYRDALEMFQLLYSNEKFPNGHQDLATCINNLGVLFQDNGRYFEAEALHQKALAMERKLYPSDRFPNGHSSLAMSICNLAGAMDSQGKYAQAEELYHEALAMRQKIYPIEKYPSGHPDLAQSVNNLAALLAAQGRYIDAERYFRDALKMRREFYSEKKFPNGHPQIARNLGSIGAMLETQEHYAESERFHRAALSMASKLYSTDRFPNGHPQLAECMNNLGATLESQREYAEAENQHAEALRIRRKLYSKERFPDGHPDLANSMINLAAALNGQGKVAEAEAFLKSAVAMHRRIRRSDQYPEGHPDLARSLSVLGSFLRTRGNHSDAAVAYAESMQVFSRFAGVYADRKSEGYALTLVASFPKTRDEYLSNAWILKTRPSTAYSQIWVEKAMIGQVFEQRQRTTRATNDPKLTLRVVALSDARRVRADLLLAPVPTESIARKKREEGLRDVGITIAKLEIELRSLVPIEKRAHKLAKVTPADLQEALQSDVAFVDFLRYRLYEPKPKNFGKETETHTDSYLAFVVTKDKIDWINLGSASQIEDAVVAWREAITSGKDIPPSLSAKVRDLVWTKVRKEIPTRTKIVYIAPDLALFKVPWAALPGDKLGTILLEDYAIAVVPHAPFLLDKLLPQAPVQERPTEILVVGGVAYNSEMPVAAKVSLGRDPLFKPGQKVVWAALPGAADEAKGVAAMAQKRKLAARTLNAEKATVPAVLSALPKARYAHLATHGFFADPSFRSAFHVDPKLFQTTRFGERVGAGALNPLVMTGLVFAGANNANTPARGVMTGEALVDLDLSGLDLAVLSACETGLGDVAGGEGTFGLQRAFHLAGTRDVVASLWKVPDRSTAALMALFYRNLWAKEMPPIEALRQAQLDIYRNPGQIPNLAASFRGTFKEVPGSVGEDMRQGPDGRAHPRLWAAFTLSGPGR